MAAVRVLVDPSPVVAVAHVLVATAVDTARLPLVVPPQVQGTDLSVRRQHRCRRTRVRGRCRATLLRPRTAAVVVAVAVVADTTVATTLVGHGAVAAVVVAVPQVHSDVRVAHRARDGSRSVRSAKNTRQ